MPTERYHCEACGWDGEDPVLRELQGEGCGGVLWTLRVCPQCGEEVYATVIRPEPQGLAEVPERSERSERSRRSR